MFSSIKLLLAVPVSTMSCPQKPGAAQVLFYVICCALAITDLVTPLQLALAWSYVALRAVHSLIHVTYNHVTHRFAVHALSTLDVFAMWSVFAMSLLRSGGGGEIF